MNLWTIWILIRRVQPPAGLFLVHFLMFFVDPPHAMGDEPAARWEAPPLQRAISVRDGRTDEVLDWESLLSGLADAEVVFLGESHTDETTHRAQLAIYQALIQRKNERVVLALEMFERDVQPDLNAYLAGAIEEEEFLEKTRPWGNYRTAYRPLVEQARTSKLPVIASNFPRPLLRRVALDGPEILESLPDDERHLVPRKLLPNSDAYWRRSDNATRGHRGMIRESDRLHSTQSLWDNAMGESCALALERHPDHLVLHINGDFHSSHWDGAAHQLRQRRPDTRMTTVSLVPTAHPAAARLEGVPTADYVIFVEARASDRQDESWSVWTQKKLDYRLHIPLSATADQPVPLLMLLVEEGLTARETLELWREKLGDEAAIAVLDPPYQERQPDFGVGGRWYWNDTFTTDLGTSVEAVERMWGYVCRHFPVDPRRVVLFGEGTGGTMAVATLLLTQRMDVEGVAWNPRQYAQLKDLPLPLPEEWGDDRPPQRSVRVVTGERDANWWEVEIAEFREVGIDAEWKAISADPWQQEEELENLVRGRLAISPRTANSAESRRYVLMESEAPRARHWARLQAAWAQQETGEWIAVTTTVPEEASAERITLRVQPEKLAEAGRLPRCPGPFGGTTIVVLPEDLSDRDRDAWFELQENDPLAAASRFHRLRLATTAGETGLESVLERLQAENRLNVLIIPAEFHADAARLEELRRSTLAFEDRMTLHWSPGLGGIRGL